MTVGLEHFLIIGAILFTIGLFGALAKRNAIAVLLSIELMLNAVNLNLIAFNHFAFPAQFDGQVFALFIVAIAGAEAAVGLALILSIYRKRKSINTEDFNAMKW